jgi:Na+/H+-dicarboxylate symporter/ABC-type amino acid transport substrate-binding protein
MFRTKNFISQNYGISLANQILISAGAGLFTGIFFGDLCRFLSIVSAIYTMLLQVVIYPYIVSTLLSNLGRMHFKTSLRLFQIGLPIYLFLALIVMLTIVFITNAFPTVITSIKAITATVTNIDLLNFFIPDNLFAALSNNYVPAVVLFCVLFGVMLQRIKSEHVLFKILDTLSKACIEFWNWLLKFAPIGVFSSIAFVSGTIHLSVLSEATEYLFLFLFSALLLSFWLIPNLISSFTDLRYRTIMFELRDILIIAVGTTVSILALPLLYTMTKNLLAKRKIEKPQTKEDIETVLLISYPFGQFVNYFIYLFIIFASSFYNQALSQLEGLLLPFVAYLTSIGSPDTVVNSMGFLASWLQMPTDMINLYKNLSLVTIYPQVLVSVMCLAFLVILSMFAYYGLLRIYWRKLFTHIFLVGIVLFVLVFSFKDWVPNPGMLIYQRLMNATINPLITKDVSVTMLPANSKPSSVIKGEDAFTRIQRTAVIRVGYYPAAIPFSYFNTQGQLVGFDVVHMYMLAKAMKAKLEFIPYDWDLINDINSNKFDIAIGGIWVTNDRIEKTTLSNPYIKNPAGFLVPQNRVIDFSSLERIQSLPQIRIGLYFDQSTFESIKAVLPNVQFYIISNENDITTAFTQNKVDAVIQPELGGMIYALGHPGYVFISAPAGIVSPYLMAYMMAKNSEGLRVFINYWLDLQKANGFTDRMYNRWILGRPVVFETPRWSIMHNVLGWKGINYLIHK